MNKCHRELRKLLERKRVQVLSIGKIQKRASHVAVRYRRLDGSIGTYFTSDTPSDTKWLKNCSSQIIRDCQGSRPTKGRR